MRFSYSLPIVASLSLVATVLLNGCITAGSDDQATQNTTTEQAYLLGSTLWVQQSAEYQALCIQAYALATERISQRCETREDLSTPLAVVFDLDETVLDNSAYTAWQVANGLAFSNETWALWTDLAAAPAVPGAVEFMNFADSLGVALFYISNRDVSALLPTQKNMRELGIPQTEDHRFLLKTTSSDKTSRRDSVRALGFEIALLIGDNLGDFDGKYDKASVAERAQYVNDDRERFADRYIVLPNPLYGTWEGALYNYDRELTEEQREELRRTQLKPADIK